MATVGLWGPSKHVTISTVTYYANTQASAGTNLWPQHKAILRTRSELTSTRILPDKVCRVCHDKRQANIQNAQTCHVSFGDCVICCRTILCRFWKYCFHVVCLFWEIKSQWIMNVWSTVWLLILNRQLWRGKMKIIGHK